MKIFPLYEGSYSVDLSKKFIPFDPVIHQPKDRPGSLFIHVRPFLIQTATDLIVLDTGLGYRDEQGELFLHRHIREAGFKPESVSLVLMSHLHYDHSGGIINETQISFPNAEYIIQRGEWETAYSKPSSSYKTEIFDVLQRSGCIRFVEGSGQLNEQVSFELTGGHTEFHQAFLIKEGSETYFFGGDVLPEPEQLIRKFMAKYDFNPRQTMELRESYGKRAAEAGWNCLYYHAKTKAMSKVGFDEQGFRII
ncbi:MAG: MBL fold metallo-hydrolase [Sphingobacteriaceae bacterium]